MKSQTSARLLTFLGAIALGLIAPLQSVMAQATADGQAAPAASTALTVPVAQAVPTAPDGPRIAPAGVTNVVATSVVLPPLAPVQDDDLRNNGTPIAMMVVGGAAIVLGAVVGGDGGTMISVAGAVIGLIGLFRYLR